ncbi:sporulation membrane protein YtrI [Oceanobacillus senegalensis]|uniref:sporulation membrane protein YtrI n=1 Tax=Oceanobacillus senegalensis TaxID=1936063 RepID=UPI000A30C02C|nr:sporulation membrane protein YtrI [Oceanobacillus senegalensis]
MHIPPYHKKPSWQRFIVGAITGGIVAYMTLLYMYGSMYEQLMEENYEMESEINELKLQNEALIKDYEDLNEKTNEEPIIESIEVEIPNWEELKLDRLIVHQLEEMVKEEINHLIGEEISQVAESDFLLERAIENKRFPIDKTTYYFEIRKLYIWDTLKLTLDVKLTD